MTTTTTISDSIRAAFPFEVEKFRLAGPDNLQTPHFGLFRSDSGACIGNAVRGGYTPHTVDDCCALAEAAQSAFDGECVAKCYFNDGHYVSVQPPKEHRELIFGTKDAIFPRLIISAGYDGRSFEGELGQFRDLCRNMSIIRKAGQSFGARIRHTHHLRDKMTELVETFSRVAQGWGNLAAVAHEMEARKIDLAAFIREVYPMPEAASQATQASFHRRTEAIVRRIMRERLTTGRPDMGRGVVSGWEAYNGIQGYVQHDMTRHGSPSDIARAIIALDDAAVARAAETVFALAS
jgi:hypothetical protein